ncbi:hypothetical protein SELMODRAFT_129339 [Selaginella moellendorffii]|uniref:Uncharacterized protein TMM-2 n=1 Tax=Selaginella moellendorffii TaxID=88036 RepID=D8T0T3_SELML|nr:hypothetical protein SELMODRAFT_129339 [Selaginella moellendorffii]
MQQNASARTDPREIRAVYDVMAATGNSWVTTIPDVCNGRWHGIECTLDTSTNLLHVVSLSFGVLSDDTAFPACSSDSTISPSIAKLVFLRRLFFYRCCSGNPRPIPPQIGRLGARLESLVLRENGHVGAVPAELASLSKLHTLDLHGNNLSSSIPPSLGNLSSLQRLDLSNNRLSGFIPSSLDKLASAIILDLSNNDLEGEIPGVISSLRSLKKLDLGNNRLSGSLPDELGRFESLLFMDLSRNRLVGGIPESFGRLHTLQDLILRENSLSFTIPESLGNITSLQVLVLSSTNIAGKIPTALGRLKSLKVLHLENNKLHGSIPREILALPQLCELNLARNSLSGPVPVSREVATKLGARLRLMNNTGLCLKSPLKHDGVEQCAELEESFNNPSQPSTETSSSVAHTDESIALLFFLGAIAYLNSKTL